MTDSASWSAVQDQREELGLGELQYCESCARRPAQGWVQVGEARFHVCVPCAKERRWVSP